MASVDRVSDEAFVTLATTDSYALGALVLARSLQRAGTSRQLCVMVTDNLSQQVRQQLGSVFDHVQTVNVLDSEDSVNLALLSRPDLGVTFTKLHCWRLTQYRKCVFMDADTLVRENIDELFEREELSAAPDVGWPDCFNSGVFVFTPSIATYQALLELALTQGSFDGGDQGLLNLYFRDWATKDIARHLPFTYNCVSTTFYTYKPALKQFGSGVKVVHFLGARKPWHYGYNTATGDVDTRGDIQTDAQRDFLQLWWQLFMQDVQNTLQSDLNKAGASPPPAAQNLQISMEGGVAHVVPGKPSYTEEQLADIHRQYQWEKGQIDYLGIDSFENIQRRLDHVLTNKPSDPSSTFSGPKS